MLQHVALAINDSEEIPRFYETILHFSLNRQFQVNAELIRQIFHAEGAVDVALMEHDDTTLEIFLSPEKEKKVFSHLCLAYRNAEQISKKATELGYQVWVKENPVNNTYFIRDKSGNIFEIKELPE